MHAKTQAAHHGAGRHYGMDWLRIAAFALLIGYHVGMAFVPWGWHVKWAEISEIARLPMLALNGWRLALLFVVSGYASAALLAKSARGRFLASRTARLLVPTIFAMAVIVPPQVWIDLTFNHDYVRSFVGFWREDYFRFGAIDGLVMPTWQHLWFVVYLFAYTLVVVGLHALLPGSVRRRIVAAFGHVLGSPWLLCALPVAWILMRTLWLFPGAEDTHALVDDLPAHWIFLPALLFGFLLRHSGRVWDAIRACWRPAGVIAVFATIAMLVPEGAMSDRAWPVWLVIGYIILRAMQAWLVIVALLGIADRYLNRDAPARAMLNEAVFPFYIIHQTIIVVFVWYLRPVAMPAFVAFLLTVAVTALGCWLFYRVGREIPVLRLLIGLKGWRAMRHDKPAPVRHDPPGHASA